MPDVEINETVIHLDVVDENAPVVIEIAARGEPGPPGDTGDTGLSVLNGVGAPASGTGSNGEFYIDTSTWTIYGPKTAGAWGSGTLLIPTVPTFTISVSAPSGGDDGDVWYQVI
jgi:hypothetical protein